MKQTKVNCLVCNADIEAPYYCSVACYDIDFSKEKRHSLAVVTDSQTKGYAGYNHGLDAIVENRGDWKRLAKEQGLTNVG